MPLNGSELIDQPWDTIFSPFTDLLGSGFYLIPIAIIGAALYVKTRNAIMVSVFIWVSGMILVSGSIFAEWPEAAYVFLIFTAMGMIGTFIGVYMNRKFYG